MAALNLPAWRWHDSEATHGQGSTAARWAALALAAVFLAWGPGAPRPAAAEPLVDATGRTQEVAVPVALAVPAGVPAQILLQALAPGKLGALVEGFKPEHAIYVDPAILRLPQVAMLTRSAAPGDVAAVAALKPGLVVDYGSVSPRYVAADEAIARELKVPAVLFSGRLADVPGVARTLAKPLAAAERGEALARQAEDILGRLKPLAALDDADRPAVYLARGADGLDALRAGTTFDEPLRLAGGRNVVNGGGGTARHLSVDDVVKLKPAVVVFSDLAVLSSPLHAALPEGTKWVFDDGQPYKVLTGPPSLNRLIGAAALAAILHPGKADMDADAIRRLETTLFPIPPGLAVPLPLQVRGE